MLNAWLRESLAASSSWLCWSHTPVALSSQCWVCMSLCACLTVCVLLCTLCIPPESESAPARALTRLPFIPTEAVARRAGTGAVAVGSPTRQLFLVCQHLAQGRKELEVFSVFASLDCGHQHPLSFSSWPSLIIPAHLAVW